MAEVELVVAAYPVDPANPPAAGDAVTAFKVGERWYVQGSNPGDIVSPAIITSDVVDYQMTIDLYAAGYENDVTKVGVHAYCINTLVLPEQYDRVAAYKVRDRWYVSTPVPEEAIYPAKVQLVLSGNVPVIDLYADGYDQPATGSGVSAKAIDPTFTFVAGQKLTAFFTKHQAYVIAGGGGGKNLQWVLVTGSSSGGVHPCQIADASTGASLGGDSYGCKNVAAGALADLTGTVILAELDAVALTGFFWFPITECS